MALIIRNIIETYNYAMEELPDKRTNDWFLVKSPLVVATILFIYYKIATDIGPNFMKDRKPFKLKKVLIVYNLFQIVVNTMVCIGATPSAFRTLNIFCSPVDYSDNYDATVLINYTYIYFIIKIVDCLDTIFFVLKKNFHQLSFLHLYHHFMMIFSSWIGIKYVAGGHSVFIGIINSYVHAIMYTYYLITNFDSLKEYALKYKKYMTLVQLAQFTMLFFAFLGPLLNPSCNYPFLITITFVPQNILMIVLFSDFYYKNYIKKVKSTDKC